MQIDGFIAESSNLLAGVADRKGSILYSAARTLSPGRFYLMGLNPGGTDSGTTIAGDLALLANRTDNAYEQAWDSARGPYREGEAPLQKRLKYIFEDILDCPLTDVCATNLIFMQTHDAGSLRFPEDANTCWPVHERMLAVVQPTMILAFGNSAVSPYGFLRNRLPPAKEDYVPSGHGSWVCKTFEGDINGRKVSVVGLPHLSRYSPLNRVAVADLLRSKAV